MADLSGFYYLHTDGALIFKRWDEGREQDLIESPFVVCYWPIDQGNRAHAWRIIIEGTVAGIHPDRIRVLTEVWKCDEADADNFAEYIGLHFLTKEGGVFKEYKIGAGGSAATKFDALVSLCRSVGWKATKGGPSLEQLVRAS